MAIHVGFSIRLGHHVLTVEMLPELVATIAFATMWLVLRGRPRAPAFIRAVEIGGLLVGSSAFCAIAVVLPLVAQPEGIVRGAITYVFLGYAAYVPGTWKRTLFVGLALTVPLMLCVFLAYRQYDPALHDPPAADWPKGPKGEFAYGVTVVSLAWWTIALGIGIAFSRVIYGLRKEVAEVKRLGQYALEAKLGEGGMGIVYRASHAMLRRPTAVKLLLPDRAGPEAVARFEREVRRTAMLTHPNTVTVFDYGRTSDGVFYYAMELLEGLTLEELVDLDGAQPEERVLAILDQTAAALAEAHDAGLIHRDVKPSNILLVERGGIADLVKVVDFGLVKDVRGREKDSSRTADALVTNVNAITGTPLYMAPESVTEPDKVDARSDLYALGAVGYWLLTGTHVFSGRSIVEVCSHHLHSAPEPPERRLGRPVSADVSALLLACLAKQPGDRPESAERLRERIRACSVFGQWTPSRAAAWWREHRGDVASRRKKERTESGRTLVRMPDATA
jgi:serine/threonine-protein kinase